MTDQQVLSNSLVSVALNLTSSFLHLIVSPEEEKICRNHKQFSIEGAEHEDK